MHPSSVDHQLCHVAPVSKRAQQVLAKVGRIDYTADNAAERILRVHGCGRKTLKEIAAALEQSLGVKLGGLAVALKGYSGVPTMTTEVAARAAGVEPEEFVRVARLAGVVPKQRRDGSTWSEWDVVAVKRTMEGHG